MYLKYMYFKTLPSLLADRHTNTDRRTDRNTLLPYRGGVKITHEHQALGSKLATAEDIINL